MTSAGPREDRSHLPSGRSLRLLELARHAVIVGAAGITTGVIVGGVGGRIVMRISARAAPDYATGASTEGGNIVGEITLPGTLALIVFVGILLGIVGAVAYLIAEPWLAWAGRGRGWVFGIFLLAVGSTSAFDPGNRDFVILGNQGLNVALFASLFLAFGVLLGPATAFLEQRMPGVDPVRPVRSGWGYLALAAFGLQFVPLFFVQFFDADASGVEAAPVPTGLMMVGLAAATLAKRIGLGNPATVRMLGYSFLTAAGAVGAFRAIDDISSILAI